MTAQCSYCLGRPCPGPTLAAARLLPSMVTAAAGPRSGPYPFTRLLLEWTPLRGLLGPVRMDSLFRNPGNKAVLLNPLPDKACFDEIAVFSVLASFDVKTA